MLRPEQVAPRPPKTEISASDLKRRHLKKAHREYDQPLQNQSWTNPVDYFYRWMVEILARRGTRPTRSETTRTPRPRVITNRTQAAHFCSDSSKGRIILFCLCPRELSFAWMPLFFGFVVWRRVWDAAGQSLSKAPAQIKRESRSPPPCRNRMQSGNVRASSCG